MANHITVSMVQTLSGGLIPTSFQPTTTAPTTSFEHENNPSNDFLTLFSRQNEIAFFFNVMIEEEEKNENYTGRV